MADSILFNVLELYSYILIGVLIGLIFRRNIEKIGHIGNFIIVNILTPIVIFATLTSSDYSIPAYSIIQIIFLEVSSVLVCWITTYYFLKKKINDNKKLGSFMFLNGLPNVMIYGIPIVIAFFPEELVVIPVIYASSALVIRGTLGMYIGERLGADVKMSIKDSIKKLLTFPPLLGIFAAMIGMVLDLPNSILIGVKNATSPVYSAMGAGLIGTILSRLSKKEIKNYANDILIVSIWRFGISFLYFIAIVYFLHFPQNQQEIRTLLMISVLGPPAVMNVSFALYFKLDTKFAAISVAMVTLFAIALLPLIVWFGHTFL